METFNGREVIRCMHCKLNQFVVSSRKCRRCHQLVEPPPVEVVNPYAHVPISEVGDPPSAFNIPTTLRLLRNAFELSQKDLARRLGCPRTYISKNESRHNTPNLESVRRFAEAFGITPYAFISLAEALAR